MAVTPVGVAILIAIVSPLPRLSACCGLTVPIPILPLIVSPENVGLAEVLMF